MTPSENIKNINTLDKTLNLDGSAHLVSILLDNQLLESNQFILKDDKLTLIRQGKLNLKDYVDK